MRKLLMIVFALVSLVSQSVLAGVTIDGDENLFKQEYWLPKKAYIAFYHDSHNKLSGYRLIFQAADGELFDNWQMRDSNGNTKKFPFILESTLIIENAGEVEKTDRWGFGRLDGNNSDTPSAFLDSTFSDWREDNYGIGIMQPDKLKGDELYDYWLELKPTTFFPTDPQNLNVTLRFRLNIDLSAAKKFGYSENEIGRDFVLGDLWKGIGKYGYDGVDVSKDPSPQDIGEYFSFAIEEYKPTGKKDSFSYYFYNLDGMEGQWCKVGNGDPYRVNSPSECFCDTSQALKAEMDDFNSISGSITTLPDVDIPTPTDRPLPNLRLHEMKVYRGDTLLHSGKNQSQVGEVFTLENYLICEEENCQNGNQHGVRDIESDVQVQIGDGAWRTFDTVLTQPGTLTKDDPHKETSHYTIPEEARGKMLRFRIKVDSDDDIRETKESDNISNPDNERYPIVGNYNLIVANATLTNGLTEVYQNTIGRVRYAIQNIGTDTPLSSQGIRSVAEVKKPGETTYSLIAEDGSDSDELTPNRLQEESTSLDGFSFNIPGIWEFRIRTDCYNKLIESNEGDNTYTFAVEVKADNRKAIIVITEARLKEGSSFKKDTRVHPMMKCKNIGDAYPAGPLSIDYLIDSRRRDGDTIQASELGPGVEKDEKVNHDDMRLGDKGNRTLTVVIKINGGEVARKDYNFKVK